MGIPTIERLHCIVKHNEAEKKEEDVEDSDGY